MIAKNPTEELVYHLTKSTKTSFHFGQIPVGVHKLLEHLKEKGFVVHFIEKQGRHEPMIISKEECQQLGIEFEHRIINN